MVHSIKTRPSLPLSQSFPSGCLDKPLTLVQRGQTKWKPQSQKQNKWFTQTTALSNSMKLWAMPWRATQDGQVTVESSDKTWSTGEGNGKSLYYSCLENPVNNMKRQKDMTLKDEIPRVVGAQYTTVKGWRNNSRKNEKMEPKQKQHPVVDVTGDGSKVWCCKEQYCIGIWNVRSTNEGKLEVVKWERARVNINILGISELKWTGLGEFNSDECYIYYMGKNPLEETE